MERSKNTVAIVLNRRAYQENALLITVYTRYYGKLNLVARGARKLRSKLAGHVEPLTLVDIMIIPGRAYDYLGGALVREAYLNLRNDLNKLYYSGRAVNIFNRLVHNNEVDQRLFFLLATWLSLIDEFKIKINPISNSQSRQDDLSFNSQLKKTSSFTSQDGKLLLMIFIIKFLAELGYQPELSKCSLCRQVIKPGNNYFNLAGGNLVCSDCQRNRSQELKMANSNLLAISDDALKVCRFIIDNNFSQILKLKFSSKLVTELFNFSLEFLNYYL